MTYSKRQNAPTRWRHGLKKRKRSKKRISGRDELPPQEADKQRGLDVERANGQRPVLEERSIVDRSLLSMLVWSKDLPDGSSFVEASDLMSPKGDDAATGDIIGC